MKVNFGDVDWEEGKDAIRSPWTRRDSSSTSASWHTGNSNERIDLTACARDLVNLASAKKDIIYDQGRADSTNHNVKCVIVGRAKLGEEKASATTLRHYVLIVVPRGSSKTEYERVGAASLPGTCIAWGKPALSVRIF